jgi:hypothetical protein
MRVDAEGAEEGENAESGLVGWGILDREGADVR